MKSLDHVSAILTHHWLVNRRGGEKVLAALCELLPGAPIHTLVHDPRGAGGGWPPVRASLLRYLPGAARHYPKLLPVLPLVARSMRLPDVDLVVCSDAAIAKAMRVSRRTKLVCYCHSPMRYVWEPGISATYRATLPALLRPLWPALCAYVRRCDAAAARRVDCFVANSRTVAERIRRCYGRESTVVYPPVELPAAAGSSGGARREAFWLCVGQHVVYKRLDLAVAACRLRGERMVVIGEGPEAARLRRECAGDGRVEFLGFQPDDAVSDHYRRARGLLFPGEEDFGIVPVEAMAHGCPVVAFDAGGAAETVIDGETGVLFGAQTVESLSAAMDRAAATAFDEAAMWQEMQRFSRERFLGEMRAVLLRVLGDGFVSRGVRGSIGV